MGASADYGFQATGTGSSSPEGVNSIWQSGLWKSGRKDWTPGSRCKCFTFASGICQVILMDIHSPRLLSTSLRKCVLFVGLAPFLLQAQSVPPQAKPPDIVSTDQFSGDVTEFLGKELSAHLADVKTPGVPQDRVIGALTLGEFSWGTFARALASYSVLAN